MPMLILMIFFNSFFYIFSKLGSLLDIQRPQVQGNFIAGSDDEDGVCVQEVAKELSSEKSTVCERAN